MSLWKKNLISAGITLLCSTAIMLPAFGQITLTNADFELPPAPNKTEYWDASGNIIPGIIPGWEPTGPGVISGGPVTGPGDSGIEFGGIVGGAATMQGYLGADDPAVYSVTNTNIVAGRGYRAEFSLRDIYTSVGIPSFQATLFYLNGSTRVPLGTPLVTTPGPSFATQVVEITSAQAAAGVGFPLGIEFDNITNIANPGVASWHALDRITFAKPGDVNDDGVIDLTDYSLIRTNFRQAVATRGAGDLVADGFVDLNDFGVWKDNVPPALLALVSIPEPSTLLLLVGTCGLACGRVGRRSP
jgi:hypothetical protein